MRHTLPIALPLLVALQGCRETPSPAPWPRPEALPHVVLVSLDTVRWDHTGLAGYARDTTPSLDALAALPGSVTFERAYASAAWSLPSYASVFTGRDAMEHGLGLMVGELDPAWTTLAEVLTAYGYRTAAFTSGPHLHPATGLGRGFATHSHQPELAPMAAVVNEALAWLDQAPPDQPLLFFLAGYDAHVPYASPSAFAEMFDPGYDGFLQRKAHREPGDPCDNRGASRTCMRVLPGGRQGQGMDPDDLAHTIAHYDSAVRAADYGLGRLLHALEQRGVVEETLLVVFADHGEGLGEEGGRFHHDDQVGDRVFHVPLVIRLPGSEAPASRSQALLSLDSLAPTLIEALGLQVPASATAPSFAAELGVDGAQPYRRDAVIGASLCCYQVRDEGWELRGRRLPRGEMGWSLHRDGEGRDRGPAEPERVAAMQALLAAWPPHPGPRQHLPPRLEAPARQELKEALRRGGYWSPDEAPAEEGR